MAVNVGTLDRTLRIVAGLALLGWALGAYGPANTSLWGWIGIIPLGTALIGWCPAYTLLGIRTCPRKA